MIMIYTCILFVAMITLPNTQTPIDQDEAAIKAAIQYFVQGADSQDTQKLAKVLHHESQQFYIGADGLVRLPRSTYFTLIDEKKIGGTPRKLNIDSINVNGNLAVAKVEVWNEYARFENYFSLMKVDNSWQIVSVILQMETN